VFIIYFDMIDVIRINDLFMDGA